MHVSEKIYIDFLASFKTYRKLQLVSISKDYLNIKVHIYNFYKVRLNLSYFEHSSLSFLFNGKSLRFQGII